MKQCLAAGLKCCSLNVYALLKWVIIGLGNVLLSVQHQAITRTNTDLLSLGCLRPSLVKFESNTHTQSFWKIHLEVLYVKCIPLCCGLNVLNTQLDKHWVGWRTFCHSWYISEIFIYMTTLGRCIPFKYFIWSSHALEWLLSVLSWIQRKSVVWGPHWCISEQGAKKQAMAHRLFLWKYFWSCHDFHTKGLIILLNECKLYHLGISIKCHCPWLQVCEIIRI